MVSMTLAAIIYRCYEVEHTMAKKYGSAWTTYTGMVKSRIIPKIY